MGNAIPPTVHLFLPEQSGLLFEVAWAGYDDGSGIAGYDVQYQIDGGAWTGWLTDTLDTEELFMAETGHTYTFRLRARDLLSAGLPMLADYGKDVIFGRLP